MGPARKKACMVLQPTIEEEPEEEAMGEVVAMGETAREVTMPEVATDEDTTMQDVPVVVPVAEAGLSAETARTMARHTMEELLGIWSDGTINRYIQLSLVEITWHNYQETHKLCKSSDWQEQLERMILH